MTLKKKVGHYQKTIGSLTHFSRVRRRLQFIFLVFSIYIYIYTQWLPFRGFMSL